MGHRGEEVKVDQRNHGPSGQDRLHKSTSLRGNQFQLKHSLNLSIVCESIYKGQNPELIRQAENKFNRTPFYV